MADSATYTNLMPLAAFPLGGLGTGSITLHASGALTEFEIFNRPAKGNKLPYSFFAIRTAWGSRTDARVLEARRPPDLGKGVPSPGGDGAAPVCRVPNGGRLSLRAGSF